MIRALLLSATLALTGCGTWDQLSTTEKVLWGAVAVGAGALVYCEADSDNC